MLKGRHDGATGTGAGTSLTGAAQVRQERRKEAPSVGALSGTGRNKKENVLGRPPTPLKTPPEKFQRQDARNCNDLGTMPFTGLREGDLCEHRRMREFALHGGEQPAHGRKKPISNLKTGPPCLDRIGVRPAGRPSRGSVIVGFAELVRTRRFEASPNRNRP